MRPLATKQVTWGSWTSSSGLGSPGTKCISWGPWILKAESAGGRIHTTDHLGDSSTEEGEGPGDRPVCPAPVALLPR